MDADFWHDRWRRNQIGYHENNFNRHLVKHWRALGVQAGARVFVPLCGKSRDIIWLAEQGCKRRRQNPSVKRPDWLAAPE